MDKNKIRILDSNDNEVDNPDLTLGYLFYDEIIKPTATPIDNITKFAWDDSDYEPIYRYALTPQEDLIGNRIAELKQKLNDTDYIISKVIEGAAKWDEYPGIREQRQLWRDEINKLELSIKKNK